MDFVSHWVGVLGGSGVGLSCHSNADVAGLFFDLEGPALSAGPIPLHGWTHVSSGLGNHQGCWVESEVVFGIGYSRAEHLGDRAGGAVRHELEHDQRVAIGAATDLIEHTTHLGDGAADEAAVGLGWWLPLGMTLSWSQRPPFLSLMWPLKVRVGANSPSLCPTICSVTKTGTWASAVVNGNGVADHHRQDRGGPRPGLDHGLVVSGVLLFNLA